ncbi:MAG TPA: CopG family ribbon-helix-helix protein [Pararobbsia sp.]|nr:CopG family ribbon-helix-helix protein [Pararobbsia sp.]
MAFKTFTAQVPSALADDVDALAERLERPRQWIIKRALASYVSWENQKDRMTREALADVDAGRVVPAAAVGAWIDSWDTENELAQPNSDDHA